MPIRLQPLAMVLSIWILATLAFGGVAGWFYAVYPLLIGALALYFCRGYGEKTSEGSRKKKSIFFLLGLLGFFGIASVALLQMIPLPSSLLGLLSPLRKAWTFGVLEELQIASYGNFFPISFAPERTQAFLVNWISAGLVFVIALKSFWNPENRRLFAYALVAFGAFLAFLGLAHQLSGAHDLFWIWDRGYLVFASYINRNHAGALFAICSTVALALLQRRSDRSTRLWLLLGLLLLLLGMLFTASRSALFAFVSSAMVFAIFNRNRSKVFSEAWVLGGAGAFAALCLAVLWKSNIFSRLGSTLESLSQGGELRLDFYRAALRLWRNSPLFGIGFGGFKNISLSETGERFWVIPEHVENDFMELLVSSGFLGLVFAAVILLPLLWLIFRRMQDPGESATRKALALGLVTFLFTTIFTFQAPLIAHQILFALLAASVLGSRKFEFRITGKFRTTLIVLASLLLTFGSYRALAFWGDHAPEVKGHAWPVPQANALIVLSEIEDSLRRNPLQANELYHFALLNLSDGNRKISEKAFARALKLDPFNLRFRILMVNALERRGYIAEALAEVEAILGSSIPITPSRQRSLNIRSAALAARSENSIAFDRALHKFEDGKDKDWRFPMIQSMVSLDPEKDLLASWQLLHRSPDRIEKWNALFAYRMRYFPDFELAVKTLSEVSLHNAQAFNVLNMLQRGLPKEYAGLYVRLKPKSKFPHFLPSHSSARNRTELETGKMEGQILTLNVKEDQSRPYLDTWKLPSNFLLGPGSSLRFSVQSSSSLEDQVFLEIDRKLLPVPIRPRRTENDVWIFEIKNIPKTMKLEKRSKAPRLTGVAFSPRQRVGKYVLGPIDLFLDTTR